MCGLRGHVPLHAFQCIVHNSIQLLYGYEGNNIFIIKLLLNCLLYGVQEIVGFRR
jgi:hypothetical protein